MYNRPSIDQFTLNDWLQAQRELSANSFKQLKRLATVAGIPIPAPVRGVNSKPRVLFDFNMSNTAREVRISDIAALNKFKRDLDEWCDHLLSDLRSSLSSMGLVSSKNHDRLIDSLETYIKYDDVFKAEPVKIGIRFARHGVFLHYGAGRGYGGRVGSTWLDRLGYIKGTNPESLGKAGTGKRPQRNWFNSVLDYHVNELADIAANYCSDMIVDSSYFYLGL